MARCTSLDMDSGSPVQEVAYIIENHSGICTLPSTVSCQAWT
jgi:hypothetical protein